MAKKKKRKSRVSQQEYKEPNLFWRQTASLLLFLMAIFLLLGSFGAGGALPRAMFGVFDWTFGLAAYLAPLALAYFAVLKFRAEDHKIPLSNAVSMFLLMVFLAGFLFTAFADYTQTQGYFGGQGGNIGSLAGGLMLAALSPIPASILFLVLAVLAMFFSFGISPLVLGGLFNVFRKDSKNDEQSDMEELSNAVTKHSFKLNEGVPVEHPKASSKVTMKNSVPMKLTKQEDHSALTAPSDPDWKFPGMDLLNQKQDKADPGDVEANAMVIQETLHNFNIQVEMEGANIGPRVTQYTLKPPAGVKLSKITALDSNIALDLGASAIRMEAPIPGKKAVGIEVPNVKSATVRISSILSSSDWKKLANPLGVVIGKDIAGLPVVGALDKMPHLLVAGQTGSGKSVMVNTLLTSLLYKNSPSDLKLILVDPKQVEMAPYADIPHLLTPVITEPEKCISALKWAVAEMERRYKTLAENRKRNIADYNAQFSDQTMPYIVIVIDELADLMMAAARDVEAMIVRIAQKARAVGIHLILATQRPSVDVITGLIKANVPARIAFTVASQVDSRTIIDNVGAEKLLGVGDMLFSTTDMPRPKRVQGAFITDDETLAVMDFLRMQRPPQYDDEVVSQPVQLNGKGGIVADYSNDGSQGDEAEFKDAVHVVLEARKASTSLLQRRLRIGYGKAARLMEQMEEQGIISQADGSRPREVLIGSMDEVFGGSEEDIEEVQTEES
ncbi:DNA translocase FtsK 4TM domain-containing protein [Candidatus Saccharibacteria bacterium]|nr:DNA translocase FtsK 4TM domain-containing protein [Candidatus Saccharibacteria bacterium]